MRDSIYDYRNLEPVILESEPKHHLQIKPKKKKKNYGYVLIALLTAFSMGLGCTAVGFYLGRQSNSNIPVNTGNALGNAVAAASETSGYNFMNIVETSPISMGSSVSSVVEAVSGSVVSINTVSSARTFYNRLVDVTSAGSGILFYEDSDKVYIITNYHVIENAKEVYISLDDENQAEATFVGSDSESDLAVISVSKTNMANAGISSYQLATFGNSDSMKVGDMVVAIGNALGNGKSATLGILSAKNKTISVDNKELDVIQTDAAINPGNSGGALVNVQGQVVGINTAKLSSSGVEGMGYSIPINTAKQIVEELMANGSVQKPYLGIQGGTVTDAMKEAYNFPDGVYVQSIQSDTGAYAGGLRAGDVIVGFDGTPITTMEELSEYIQNSAINQQVRLQIYRNNAVGEITVTISNLNKEANF